MNQLFHHARKFMADWTVGDSYSARRLCRRMINAQISPLSVSIDTQDLIDDLIKYKERALCTHIVKALPKFMLKTPGMETPGKSRGYCGKRDPECSYPRSAGWLPAQPCR